jgi:hypothetical protein
VARTIAGAERTLLAGRNVAHFLRVQVRNTAGTLVDLRSVGGRDYQLSATIVSNVDTPADTATVVIRAGNGATSVAPLMTSASANSGGRLIDVGRGIVIDVAVLAIGSSPSGGDWRTVFDGTIDTVSQGDGQRLTLSCRNRMLPILDASSASTTAILPASAESMIASLLTLGLSTGAPTLVTPSSPGWSPAKIDVQRGDSVWQKIATIADQIGWLVRYRWNGNTPELRFSAPNRSLASADWTLAASEVAAVREAALDLAAVRNEIQVGYRASPTAALQVALAQDSASITAYGTRRLIIDEEASSQIDTLAEAQAMADAILSDLKVPPYSHTLTHRHAFWAVEVGDIIDVAANGVTHDATQRLAVVGTELALSSGGGSMTLRLRGAPASRTSSWLTLGGAGDPLPPALVARVLTQGDGTRTRVQVDTVPAGGTVQLLSSTATRLAGLTAGTSGSAPQTWDFERPAFGAGQRSAEFRGEVAGLSDDDAVVIEEQGRDTVAILTRARVISIGSTTYTIRVSASNPIADADGTITIISLGGMTCTMGGAARVESPASVSTDTVTVSTADGYYGTIGGAAAVAFRDYVVTRPAIGAQPARFGVRVTASGLSWDADAVDVEPQRAATPGRITVIGGTQSGADYTIRFNPFLVNGASFGSVAELDCTVVRTPAAGGAPSVSTVGVNYDIVNFWFTVTITRVAGDAYTANLVILAQGPTARTDLTVPVPTYTPAGTGDLAPRIESVSVTNTGTSSTAGDLRVVFGGVNLPSGGSYRLSVDGSTFISANVFTSASSPVTILSAEAYTDGVAPPSGKSSDRARGLLEMLDSGGATVDSRAIPYNEFFGII